MTGVKRPPSPTSELRAFKWLALAHGLGIVTFFVLMITFFWYLRHIETEGQQQTMYRDIEWAQRTMRLRWRDLQDELSARAGEWAAGGEAAADAPSDAPGIPDFLSRNPDVSYVAMVDARRQVRWVLGARGAGAPANRQPGTTMEDSAGFAAQKEARTQRRPTFSDPLIGDHRNVIVEMHVPVLSGERFEGTMIVAFSLERTLYTLLSREVLERYQLSIVDARGDPLVGTAARTPQSATLSYELPLDPPGHGLRLRAYGFAVQSTLIERTLLTAVAGLAIAGVVTLILLWRHARRRAAAEATRDGLFTLSLDLMALMRLDGSFVRVNPAFGQTLGPTPGWSGCWTWPTRTTGNGSTPRCSRCRRRAPVRSRSSSRRASVRRAPPPPARSPSRRSKRRPTRRPTRRSRRGPPFPPAHPVRRTRPLRWSRPVHRAPGAGCIGRCAPTRIPTSAPSTRSRTIRRGASRPRPRWPPRPRSGGRWTIRC